MRANTFRLYLIIDRCSLIIEKMPLYEYRCHDCGEFAALRSLLEYNTPVHCPQCNTLAKKIFSAPNINLNSGSLSLLSKRNSTEPRLIKQESRESAKPRYQQVNNNRPWMISHAPTRY
jgi:putative FmdB family regulatory protein